MPKSADAFRTISEVADWLGIQAHVLRFWESKFTQVRPVKRAGGRRYYRPGDMLLLGGIKQLLHEDGLTIKGVQKILREEGMSHVSKLSQPLDELTQSQLNDMPETQFIEAPEEPVEETGVVLSFESAPQKPAEPEQPAPVPTETEQSVTTAKTIKSEPPSEDQSEDSASTSVAEPVDHEPAEKTVTATHPIEEPEVAAPSSPDEPAPTKTEAEGSAPAQDDAIAKPDAPEPETTEATLPAFLRRPMDQQSNPSDNPPPPSEPPAPSEPPPPIAKDVPDEPKHPKPRIIDMPVLTPEREIVAAPAILTAAFRARHLSTKQARQIAPLLDRLAILRDSMAARRRGGTHTGPNS